MPRVRRRARIVESSSSDSGPLSQPEFKKIHRPTRKPAVRETAETWDFDFSPDTLQAAPKTRKPESGRVLRDRPTKQSVVLEEVPTHTPNFDLDRIYNAEQAVISECEIIIHKKKVAEAEEWFKGFNTRMEAGRSGIMMVTGPTGSGKTTCIRYLCQKYSIQVCEGLPKADMHYQDHTLSGSPARSRKSPTAPSYSFPTLTLVRNEGESFIHKTKSFTLVLWDHLPSLEAMYLIEKSVASIPSADSPSKALQMVLIVTDPCDRKSWTEDLALRRIKEMPETTLISFNPIAPSFVQKLLKLSPGTNLDRLDGDMRACLIDGYMDRINAHCGLDHGKRDASFTIFHSVGKIFYPRGEKDDIDASALTESDRPAFHGFLNANYLKFFANLDSLASIAEDFSWLDAVPWGARTDPLWEALYSSLPETNIHFESNKSTSRAQRFISIEAPDPAWYLGKTMPRGKQDDRLEIYM